MSNAAYVLRRYYEAPPLMVRQLHLSGYHGQLESYHHLGDYYSTRNMTTAVMYYSRASVAKHSMSTLYLAAIHHFGIGIPVNVARAERYYATVATEGDHAMIKYAAQALRMIAHHHDSVFVKPVHAAVCTVIALLWN